MQIRRDGTLNLNLEELSADVGGKGKLWEDRKKKRKISDSNKKKKSETLSSGQ